MVLGMYFMGTVFDRWCVVWVCGEEVMGRSIHGACVNRWVEAWL